MEQRREPRFEAEQEVRVTLLEKDQSSHAAVVKNASARGLALQMGAPAVPGAAIKIELDDAVILGEAVYCRADGDSYLVGVELDQILCGLSELGKKLQEFAAEQVQDDRWVTP